MNEQLHTPNQSLVQRALGGLASRAGAFTQGWSEIWDAGNFPTVYPARCEQPVEVTEQKSLKTN